MYGTTATYRTDHSNIFSEQVNNNCAVHIITYRYRWISYPVYSKYNIGVFQVRRGIEYGITYKVKIIVTVRDSNVYYDRTRPAKATEYVNSSLTRNEYGTTREPSRVSGWRSQRITIHSHHRNRRR
jgi:hypothetical protein